jgi:hypothetical protein
MTKLMKMITVGTMVLAISATGMTAFADSPYKTPAEAVGGLTGSTVESVIAKKIETGKTYGTLAKEAGELNAFKTESFAIKKANLEAQVEAGTLTREKADAIIKEIEVNQVNCDGSDAAKIGQKTGAKFGSEGKGLGNGGVSRGAGLGQREGQREGQRMGGNR